MLCLQDTTELDYNGYEMTGPRPLSYETQRGLYLLRPESYEPIAEQVSELRGTRHVCIGDRESDILALLVMAREMNHAADLPGALPVQPNTVRRRQAVG